MHSKSRETTVGEEVVREGWPALKLEFFVGLMYAVFANGNKDTRGYDITLFDMQVRIFISSRYTFNMQFVIEIYLSTSSLYISWSPI